MSAISEATRRINRLFASDEAKIVEMNGPGSPETRPCMLGALSRFLRDEPTGQHIKRAFAAGLAAIALSGALSQPIQASQQQFDAPPSIQTLADPPNPEAEGAFSHKTEVDRIFASIATGVNDGNMSVATLDVQDAASIDAFKIKVMSLGGSADLANQIVSDISADNHGNTPVAMSHYAIQDPATGEMHPLAVVSFDASHDHYMADLVKVLDPQTVELSTYTHELAHSLHKQSEQKGLEAFVRATNGDFSAFDKWNTSVEGQMTHPDVRQVIQEEVSRLRGIDLSSVTPDEMSAYVGNIVSEVREIQSSDGHLHYQEHFADALASLKFAQDGHDIAKTVGDFRATGDAIHNTSATQRVIAENFSQENLKDLSATELASLAAHVVKDTLKTSDANFQPINDGLANGASPILPGHDAPSKGMAKESAPAFEAPYDIAGIAAGEVAPSPSSRHVLTEELPAQPAFEAPYDIAGIAAGEVAPSPSSRHVLTEERPAQPAFEAPYDITGIAAGKAVEPGVKHILTEERPVQDKPFVHPGRVAFSQLSDPAHYATEKSGFEAPYNLTGIADGTQPPNPGTRHVLTEERPPQPTFEAPYDIAGIAAGKPVPDNPNPKYAIAEERPAPAQASQDNAALAARVYGPSPMSANMPLQVAMPSRAPIASTGVALDHGALTVDKRGASSAEHVSHQRTASVLARALATLEASGGVRVVNKDAVMQTAGYSTAAVKPTQSVAERGHQLISDMKTAISDYAAARESRAAPAPEAASAAPAPVHEAAHGRER